MCVSEKKFENRLNRLTCVILNGTLIAHRAGEPTGARWLRVAALRLAMVQATSTFSISHIDDGNGASANSR